MLNGIVDRLLGVPGWLVLVLSGLIVFAEDAIFVGFVIPGETVAILAGVAAKLGHVPLPAVLTVVIAAAIAGDSVGYEVGRLLGPRLLSSRLLAERRWRLEQAQQMLVRRGGTAVFLGRWTAFFRAVMPALAGVARMPYRKFLAFNALGGLAWGATVVMIGYAAGASYAKVEKTFGRYSALIVAGIVVFALLVWRSRRRSGRGTTGALGRGARGTPSPPTPHGTHASGSDRPPPDGDTLDAEGKTPTDREC